MLSLFDSMGEFDSRESNRGRTKGLEPQHRSASLLDGPMVLLNHIVEISACPHLHLPPAGIFVTQQSQASKGCFIFIDVDFIRPRDSSMSDNSSEKCLRRLPIAITAEQ